MDDSASNRDIGNAWISYILGELYDQWPRRIDLNAMEVASKTETPPRFEDEDLFDDTIDWLKSEGYIRTSNQAAPEGMVFGAALTEKGYAVLGSTPDSLSSPFGLRLKEAAKEGGPWRAGRC